MSAFHPHGHKAGSIKIRLTVLCAKNLAKKEIFRFPDPFAKISVEDSGQIFSTEACQATLDPKWNQYYDLHLRKKDAINISVWNKRKVSKKVNTGFLGCIRLAPSLIHRIKDTGYQRLELTRNEGDNEPVRGQIIVSLMTRDGRGLTSKQVNDVPANIALPGDLPEGWEERRTTNGRVYYVNHATRTTHWNRPIQNGISSQSDNETQQRSHNLSSIFGNIVLTNPTASNQDADPSPVVALPQRAKLENKHSVNSGVNLDGGVSPPAEASSASTPTTRDGQMETRSEQHRHYLARNHLHQPVDLPQGYEIRTTNQGQVYYYNTLLGTSTWHDPRVPRDLGNINPEDLGALPPGWELRFTRSGRPYFLNHIRKTTQFSDPRLANRNILSNILRSRRADTASPNGVSSLSSVQNNEQIADSRNGSSSAAATAAISSPTSDQNANSSSRPENVGSPVVTAVSSDVGARERTTGIIANADERLNNSIASSTSASRVATTAGGELVNNAVVIQNDTTATPPSSCPTLLDDESDLPKYNRDLVAKLKLLRSELQLLQPQSGHCRLEIPRKEIFEESFKQIMKLRPKDMRKRLMVKFRGEEGLDYGGVAREWLYLLSHEMLNPYYGLFQYSREDIYTLQINHDSFINPEHLSYFHFVGRVIGMAVFHGHYIDGGFTMPFYKMLLSKPIVLDDIEGVDPELHRSLNWMLENDISGIIDTTFSVEHDSFGDLQRKELKKGGGDVQVTEMNKKEYVRLYVLHRFMQGIEKQFSALQKGFAEVVPQHLLLPFDERELELLIGGLGKIDLEDWKKNTRLKHCTPETPVVGWFWKIVDSYSEEMRARLLQFVTGSSRVPLQGFKALQGSTGAAGPRLFTIHVIQAHTENLPKAHTCFNRIDLPPYPSYEKMHEKLTQAVEETCGFAVE